MQETLFSKIHGSKLIYNTCWEDPRIDRAALNLNSDSNVICITSAGCNILDYALAGAGSVHAVDVNPRQNALLELKLAAARGLNYDDYFSMFGKGKLKRGAKLYEDRMREHLGPFARNYWDKHIKYFAGAGWRPSFYFRGTSGLFAKSINFYIDSILDIREKISKLLQSQSIEEQRMLYQTMIKPRLWSKKVQWFMSQDTTLALLGVPRAQRYQIDRHIAGGVSSFVESCLDAVFGNLSIADNYFWRVYLTGQYEPNCCPEYLTRDGYEQIRDGLHERIHVHTGTLLDVMRETSQQFSDYILLDHMDWLASAQPGALKDEWQWISNTSRNHSRVLWRSASPEVDFVDPIEVSVNGRNRPVGEMLMYLKDLASQLHQQDRVHTYGSFYIADLGRA